jgi:hypothetical protein
MSSATQMPSADPNARIGGETVIGTSARSRSMFALRGEVGDDRPEVFVS